MTIKLQGRDYVTHEELVQEATEKHGLNRVQSELVHVDYEARLAVFRSTVVVKHGTFEAFGDASPANVSRNIAPHWLRMAETRAVSRALRLATGRGTAAEELDSYGSKPSPDWPKVEPKEPPPQDTGRGSVDAEHHHESWEQDRRGFCAWLSEQGISYVGLARWTQDIKGWGRPSWWSRQKRQAFRERFDEHLEEHLIWAEKVSR